ncbi:unnamed protein product, partial [marine sediment metagenome]
MIKKANCMFCHRNCGMLIEVQGGKIVKVNKKGRSCRARITYI